MSGELQQIDIEKIMDEIRADIKEKGYTADMLDFQDVSIPERGFSYNESEFENLVNAINATCSVPWYRDLGNGGIKVFVKKVIRKIMTFLIAPIAEDQMKFNVNVANTVNQLAGYVKYQNDIIDDYKNRIIELEKKVKELEK